METLWQDIKYGFRSLRKTPGFTIVAILTLALGIGANSAIFSVVNAVLLRPLPFAKPEQLVAVGSVSAKGGGNLFPMSYPNFADIRAQNQTLSQMAVYATTDFTLTSGETPMHLAGAIVSAELFSLLGVTPQIGRDFRPEEDNPSANPNGRPLILSHALWSGRFSADPHITGQTLTINGKTHVVVGVMPVGFQFPLGAAPVDAWTTVGILGEKTSPNELTSLEERSSHFLQAVGRLKPNVSVEQSQADIRFIGERLKQAYSDVMIEIGADLAPLHQKLIGNANSMLWTLLGVTSCLLIITCANVANLLLTRATNRYKEFAVRIALGAGRIRIFQQLLTESVLLAALGGLGALAVAASGVRVLVTLIPDDVPRLTEITLDGDIFAFTSLVSLITGLAFGLAPAFSTMRSDMIIAIRDGGRGTSESGKRLRTRSTLVISEIAITLVVLVGAGLLASSFVRLMSVPPGFNPRNVLTAHYDLPATRYPKIELQAAFHLRAIERVAAIPGVTSVSTAFQVPLGGANAGVKFNIEGEHGKSESPRYLHSTSLRAVGPDYFTTLAIPVQSGRQFTQRDTPQAAPVVIVNQAFVRKFFPNQNPIGKRVDPSVGVDGDSPPMREIIGVVGDVRHNSLATEAEPEAYLPHLQTPFDGILVIRTSVDPASIVGAVERAMRELDSNIPLYQIKTLEQYLGARVAKPFFNALLVSFFAGVALLLTAIGLYGVVAYSVAHRTNEIGIRMALGAQIGDVFRMVLGQGMKLAVLGVSLGLAGAFAVTRLIESLLFGVTPTDPLTFIFIPVLLVGVTLIACWIPARRATKVDPMIALRQE